MLVLITKNSQFLELCLGAVSSQFIFMWLTLVKCWAKLKLLRSKWTVSNSDDESNKDTIPKTPSLQMCHLMGNFSFFLYCSFQGGMLDGYNSQGIYSALFLWLYLLFPYVKSFQILLAFLLTQHCFLLLTQFAFYKPLSFPYQSHILGQWFFKLFSQNVSSLKEKIFHLWKIWKST